MKSFISLVFLIGLPLAAAMAEPDIEVRKSVNNAFPAVDEPVEFSVQVSNIGDETAVDVVIRDQLPPEMEIPAGTAAFASVGDYDPATGAWTVGNMDAGVGATLVVPAVVTDPQPPACIVNSAVSEFSGEGFDDNNEARAGVKQNGIERCVDLSAISHILAGFFPVCDSREAYFGTIEVSNMGPDAARNVVVSFVQSPVVGASIRFDDPRCAQSGSAVCEIVEIGAGEFVLLNITSDSFQNYTVTEFQMDISVSTSDVDYLPANDLSETMEFTNAFSSCDESNSSGFGFDSIGPDPCFIATAAYGSALDPHLDSLRYFRDSYLLTNYPGRAIVAFYYKYSPPLADFIADRDWLRAIVRAVLTPMVYVIEYPGIALLIVIAMVALFLGWRQRVRKSRTQSLADA
jgi:uncharacterized repeat protein (TIGR01451 family)